MELSNKLDYYKSIKYFTVNNIEYSINHEFLKNELDWLYLHIDKIFHYKQYNISINDEIYNNLAKMKYQQLIIYLKQIISLYAKLEKSDSNKIIENLEDIQFLNDPIKAFYNKILICFYRS